MTSRQPAVSGLFYPLDATELLGQLDGFLADQPEPGPAKVAVMPHAGYVYSGSTAGAVAAGIHVPRRVILLGPKHRRQGAKAAISSSTSWSFPFGEVPVDREMALVLANEAGLEQDDLAHRDEHSLEVQVPFLWRRNPELLLTPVALGLHRIEELRSIGEAIARVVAQSSEPVLVVASTDMSHQIPIALANRLDNLAIERILELDPAGLYETVFSNDISMCGVIPVTAALYAARAMGAAEARLVQYTTSADASGDTSSVVGYAGIVID